MISVTSATAAGDRSIEPSAPCSAARSCGGVRAKSPAWCRWRSQRALDGLRRGLAIADSGGRFTEPARVLDRPVGEFCGDGCFEVRYSPQPLSPDGGDAAENM